MAVAFMLIIKELRRNSGKTAATAENRHQPPILFLPFLAELYISESFEPNLFFSKIFTLTFELNTCDFFGLIVRYFKYYKCQMQK